jgi:hypothetical protein
MTPVQQALYAQVKDLLTQTFYYGYHAGQAETKPDGEVVPNDAYNAAQAAAWKAQQDFMEQLFPLTVGDTATFEVPYLGSKLYYRGTVESLDGDLVKIRYEHDGHQLATVAPRGDVKKAFN